VPLRNATSPRKRLLVHLSQAVETLALAKAPNTLDIPFKGSLNGRVSLQSFAVTSGEFGHFENISSALIRVEKGTYGRCSLCGGRIEAEALAIAPWATECLECWDQESQT
jgi:hypothetical protein